MTGAELKAQRQRAGMTQAQLANAAYVGRSAVTYWESKRRLNPLAWAAQRIVSVLQSNDECEQYARAGGGNRKTDARLIALAQHLRQLSARRRVVCGAKTRKGTPCRCRSEPGKRRCRFHGGKSTGAKTPEGRARIAMAQKHRWAHWHSTPEQVAKS